MTEDAPATPPVPEAPQDSGQTIEASLDAFGDTPPQPGQTYQFHCISVDSNSKVANLSLVKPEAKPAYGGTDDMANSMDEQPVKKGM